MSGAHPTDAELKSLVEGRLGASQAISVREHTLDCDVCSEKLDVLESGDASEPPVQRLGRYVIIDLIGEGGMGRVMRAYDPQLDRRTALKLVRPDLANSESAGRLVREAQAMAKVQHPNIVAVFDAGEVDDKVFVAMELVDGPTLIDWLKEPRPWREVVQHFIEAGRGLYAAHQAGLVHRDFKPANVLLVEGGTAKVTDFGLARSAASTEGSGVGIEIGSEGTVTVPGLVMGTPAYMAPEQRRGTSDARSDQYSFGISLFEALHGHRPNDGSKVHRPIPRWLELVVRRLLQEDPAKRFPSMAEAITALERGLNTRQARVYIAIAAALMFVVFGGLLLERNIRSSRCDGATSALDRVFGTDRHTSLSARFETNPWAKKAFLSVEPALSHWSSTWAEARLESCQANRLRGELSDQLYSLQGLCLDRSLNDFDAVVSALEKVPLDDAHAGVESIHELGEELPTLTRCTDRERLLRRTERESEAQQRVALPFRARMTALLTLALSGHSTEALAGARTLKTEVIPLNDDALISEASSLLGQLEISAGSLEAGKREVLDAWSTAMKLGDDDTALSAWLEAMPLIAADEPTIELAQRLAFSLADRVGRTPQLEAEIAYRLGRIHFQRGEYKPAAEAFHRARELRTQTFGTESPKTILATRSESAALARAGEETQALALQREVLEAMERAQGTDSILTTEARSDYGAQLVAAGREAEAIPLLQSSLERFDREGSTTTLVLYSTLDNLAFALMHQGNLKQARVLRDRLVALSEAKLPASPQLGDAYVWRAEIALREGRPQDALNDATRGIEVLAAISKTHADLDWARAYEAEASMALGKAKNQLTVPAAATDDLSAQQLATAACVLRPSEQAKRAAEAALTFYEGNATYANDVARMKQRARLALTPWTRSEPRCSW